ncbi:MAG: diaminopimelate epimerase [Saprospiraceae bacterium]|nr:diaminopimelate epimerase [Saprospiraceae bacterium]
MKIVPFEKYEGAGNDFIILDFFDHGELIDLNDQELIEKMCNRRYGIGADGLIALCRNNEYDFQMKYLNADGLFSTFCGNGSRCITMYAHRKWNRDSFRFLAADGQHESRVLNSETVKVKMKDINAFEVTNCGVFVDSGSPHLIHFVTDSFTYDVNKEGRKLRNEFSKEGANVNFIDSISTEEINIATYERGVENETLACGTGIAAAAYYSAIFNKLSGQQTIKVNAKGGALEVQMTIDGSRATDIWLTGPAKRVYSGFWG